MRVLPSLPLRALSAAMALLSTASWAASSTTSPSATGARVLIVHDADSLPRSSLSTLESILATRGYSTTFRQARESQPALVSYDEPAFDHVLLLSGGGGGGSTKTLPSDLAPQKLVSFLQQGGNLVVGLSASTLTPALRDFAREFSLEFQERGRALVDHFRAQDGSGRHTAVRVGGAGPGGLDGKTGLYAGGLVENSVIFSPSTIERVRNEGLLVEDASVHQVGDVPLAFPLVLPPGSSFSADPPSSDGASPEEDSSTAVEPLASVSDALTGLGPFPPVLLGNGSTASGGGQGAVLLDEGAPSLVSAFQLADNSARALWIGTPALFSDAALASSDTSGTNRAVAEDLLSWALQEKGVLRVVGTRHTRVRAGVDDVRPAYEGEGREGEEGYGEGQRMYRVKDTVTYSIELEQYTPELGWSPAPRDLDLQVTLNMIDPYITVPLTAQSEAPSSSSDLQASASSAKASKASTTYTATFQLPDRHGVFSFVLLWRRAGWSYLQAKDTAPVRPFNHDEHPRFLSAAWPYVGGAWSTVVGFVLFVGVWLSLDWARLGGVAGGRGGRKVKVA